MVKIQNSSLANGVYILLLDLFFPYWPDMTEILLKWLQSTKLSNGDQL